MREPRPWEAVWAAVEGRFQGSILIPALPLTHCVNSGCSASQSFPRL